MLDASMPRRQDGGRGDGDFRGDSFERTDVARVQVADIARVGDGVRDLARLDEMEP